jgi:predicted PurR-regulated permease PerM
MPNTRHSSERSADLAFARRVFIVVAIGALVAAIWVLSDIVLLAFGAALFAVALHALAAPLQAHLHLGRPLSLLLSGSGIVLALAVAAILLGPELTAQMQNLLSTLPEAANRLTAPFQLGSLAELIKDGTAVSALSSLASRVIAWSSTVAGALASFALVIFAGIYLAIDPALYRDGLVKLMPPSVQPNVRATLDDAGEALRRWLAGQLIAMLVVGGLTGVGLWLVGIKSAFALGLIAGLAEFVPIIGPVLAALPVILIASTQDWQTVVLAIGVIVVVQQLESNLIMPLIADRMVSIAPAVGLFAVVAMGVMFGPLGLLLGFPLTIFFDIAIRRLYVRDTLGESVKIMGKPAHPP